MNKDWLLVQSKPRQESRALTNLERQGFESYCPIVTYKKWYRGQYELREQFLFPRYIFIHTQTITPENWTKIKYTYGIAHIVRLGNTPIMASDEIIQRIKQQVLEFNSHPQPLFQPNQKVIIKTKGLEELEAIFQMPKGEDRAIVLIQFLQRHVPATVHISQITAAL